MTSSLPVIAGLAGAALFGVALFVVVRPARHVCRGARPGRLSQAVAWLARLAAKVLSRSCRASRAAWQIVRVHRHAPPPGPAAMASSEGENGPYADADTTEDPYTAAEPDSSPGLAVPGTVRPAPAPAPAPAPGPARAPALAPVPGPAPASAPAPAPMPAARLDGVKDSLRAWLWGERGVAGEFLLASSSVTLGRDPDRGIVLSDLTISREHATLDYRDGNWWLLPGVTSNGTWLNGGIVQPGERVPVGDGDRLRFGLHTQLRMLVPPPLVEPMMRFVAAARTAPGARAENQDAHLATERLLVVADGLSDRPSPRIASWTAVREIAAAFPQTPLPDVIDQVNETVRARGSDALQLKGMATTLDLVRLRRDETRGWRVEGAHIGDGQVLLQDSFGIRQVTHEGTAGGRLAAVDPARAECLADDPEFSRLTSAVGFARPIAPDLWWMHADREQRLVLATDGLLSALGTDGICAALRHGAADAPAEVADKLIRLAIEAGAPDNVTLIVADITGSDKCYLHRHRGVR